MVMRDGRAPLARRLRRQMTDAESLLWRHLRHRRLNGWKFKRQVPIDRYVVDFCCADARVIIEVDGGQHADQIDHDAKRTDVLSAMGYLVVRFWNNDVLTNINGVLETIMTTLDSLKSVPPLPKGRGGRAE